MCLSDNICKNENIDSSQEKSADFLPEQFKTVKGKMVSVIGKQQSGRPVLLSYSLSRLQASALLNSETEDVLSLLEQVDSLFNKGFFENDKGEEVDNFILPLDAVDLSPDLRGVIVDSDLRLFTNGFVWLLNPDNLSLKSGNLVNALSSILNFVTTMKHIQDKGCYMRKIDGHNFFFNAEYGMFYFVWDSPCMVTDTEPESSAKSLFETSVSSIIMFLLTGSWPLNSNNEILEHGETDADLNASEFFKSLPDTMQTALQHSCMAETRQNVSLSDWELFFKGAISEVENCVFCGKDIFASNTNCMHCGAATRKADLLTSWVVQNKNRPLRFKISFGRGTILTGDIVGVGRDQGDLMKLMYNSRSNSLGLKNLSSLDWHILKNGSFEKTVHPDSIAVIQKDIEIEFENYPEVTMRFLGYETNDCNI